MQDNYSVYIHIPFCKARCGYCVFSSCTDYTVADEYVTKLCREMEYYADKSRPIYTVYLGGGTPSTLRTEQLDKIFGTLYRCFNLSQTCEITVECNPESTSAQLLQCLVANGVSRISFGLQSANDATLQRIGRLHNFADFANAYNLARTFGLDNISADIIIGLPETRREFMRTVDAVSAFGLDHISMYALELHPNTPLYGSFPQSLRYSDDELADMYDSAVQLLCQRGYARYEISNFARKDKQCKHNLNYWQEGRYYAFGAAASGFTDNTRFSHPFSVAEYLAADAPNMHCNIEELTYAQQAEEYVMLGLRLACGIDTNYLRRRFGCDFYSVFTNAHALLKQGFLQSDGGRVFVPADKLYVINSILCELLNFE